MSLVSVDIDSIIASHIFGRSRKWNELLIHRIYYVFGKSQFNDFLIACRSRLLEFLYEQYKTQDFKSILLKLLQKKNLHFYDCYRAYNEAALNPKELVFRDRTTKHRLLIYYLSFYYGYLHICIKNVQCENFGYDYSHVQDKFKTEPIPYHILKKHRVHNLEYYDLVELKPQFWNNLYKFKEDVYIGKKGCTTEKKDFLCIKIMSIDVQPLV